MAEATNSTEIWKDIPGLEGKYQASSFGQIRSLERYSEGVDCLGRRFGRTYPSKVLAQHNLGLGYVAACITNEGKSQNQYVHRLVCAAFHGPCPDGKRDAHHKDNNRGNNIPSNLEWVTSAENQLAKNGHGTMPRGERHHKAKVNSEVVKAARQMRAEKYTNKQIAEKFNISQSQVQRIVTGEHWSHIK